MRARREQAERGAACRVRSASRRLQAISSSAEFFKNVFEKFCESASPCAATAIEYTRWSCPQLAGNTEDGCSSVAPAPTRGGQRQVHRPGPGGGLHDRSARFSQLRH